MTCKGIAPEPGRSRVWPPSSRAVCVRRSASGRRGAIADDARTREVGPRHSSNEAGEQSEGSPPRRRPAGAVVAESVERRAGAKGNTHQQSTYWTQSQVRVSQALARIRQLVPSHTRGRSRMRESRTYGSVRGACDETHVPTATTPRLHHAARRGGGSLAARSARAAARAHAAHRRAGEQLVY